MTEKEIKDIFEPVINSKGLFLVDIALSKDDDITLTIESMERTVNLDDCVELSHRFEELFDRENGDYSLTVSSAGLDQPFKVLQQYRKAKGSKVEVSLKGGRKFVATLSDVTEEGITLEYTAMEAVEGKKKKTAVAHNDSFAFSEINAVKPFITFE